MKHQQLILETSKGSESVQGLQSIVSFKEPACRLTENTVTAYGTQQKEIGLGAADVTGENCWKAFCRWPELGGRGSSVQWSLCNSLSCYGILPWMIYTVVGIKVFRNFLSKSALMHVQKASSWPKLRPTSNTELPQGWQLCRVLTFGSDPTADIIPQIPSNEATEWLRGIGNWIPHPRSPQPGFRSTKGFPWLRYHRVVIWRHKQKPVYYFNATSRRRVHVYAQTLWQLPAC